MKKIEIILLTFISLSFVSSLVSQQIGWPFYNNLRGTITAPWWL